MKCALCLASSELRNSHIIPEFMYQSLYDDKHRFYQLSLVPGNRHQFKQKGLREPLLCDDCEQRLSVPEGYARELFFGLLPVKVERTEHFVYLSGLDYRLLKLFQLSILWRAGASTLPDFEQVRLGPHADCLRRMLLAGDPGRAIDYGCVTSKVLHEAEPMEGLLVPPTWVRFHGQKSYRFIFSGIAQLHVVSNSTLSPLVQALFLQESGTAMLALMEVTEIPYLMGALSKLNSSGRP
jgi:hypothetical protein